MMTQVWLLALCGLFALTASSVDAAKLTKMEKVDMAFGEMPVAYDAVLDLVFVIDTGSQAVISNQATIKTFLQNVAVFFWVAPTHVRISVVTYSTGVKVAFNLNTYTNYGQVANAIQQLQFTPGSHNTYKALNQVANQQFTAQYGSRAAIDNVAIVITNGGPSSLLAKNTQAANLLKKKAKIFVLSVGSFYQKGVQAIASSPSSYYAVNAPNYSHVKTAGLQLIEKVYYGYKNKWNVSGYQQALAQIAKKNPVEYHALTGK